MDQALSWVGDIVRALLQFIPRLVLVRATHGAVRFRFGKKAIEMKPGVHFYWPLVTEVDRIVVARQSQDIPPQVLTTADGASVAVAGFATYGISNVVRAIGSKNWDVDGTVKEICAAAIAEVIVQHTLAELRDYLKSGELRKMLTAECKKQLRQYGVAVKRCSLTDFATCRVYRVIGGTTA